VDASDFYAGLRRWAPLEGDAAARSTQAVLVTLAERLHPGEAAELAAELPADFLRWLHTDTAAEPIEVDEFLRRVAEREGADLRSAERDARAVFAVIRDAVSAAELGRLEAALPEGFRPLLRSLDVVSVDELVADVAARAGVDEGQARQLVEAVLEALAERIAEGDVRDLQRVLPVELHEALKQGLARRRPHLRPEELLSLVADRCGIPPDEARAHVRAVLEALEGALDEEFHDITAQLPPEFSPLLPRP
jgi:uncharacterized protein (DUF2267 family)